jgi:predicted deacylase
VVLWSQMHGDEPTATLALVDLIRYVVENRDDPLVQRLSERLTVVMIPMLNPDGAQRKRRENAAGIDVNRDARRQASPEARALAGVHARVSPHFGFNLHDQAPRVGEDGRAVAISLLAPPHEPNRSDMPTRTRAKRLAAVMRVAADSLVEGRVTRYDDAYNAQAFGDAMQSWGTSTVLVETGSWDGDADKEYLRRVNFALLLVALDAIATGSFEHADLNEYDSLPGNRGSTGR